MTTTELIKILQDNETGAISLKPREISLTINGIYMPNPQINLSSTGDGICGAEIDLDVCGKWLEQEPSEDAISRQAVLDLVNADWKYEGLEEDVSSLPPVTPQSKMGRWIYKQYGDYPEQGDYHCSECDGIDNRIPAYCPNCGAKMDEPQERSDKE